MSGVSQIAKFIPVTLLSLGSLLFFLGGLGTLISGVELLRHGEASKAWPSVRGRIDNSYLDRESNDNGSLTRAHVEYSYSVNGEQFHGHRIGFGDFGAGEGDHAERIVSDFPRGAETMVYYLESSPRIATLRPGLHTNPWPPILGGLAFCFVGALIGAAAYKEGKTKLGNSTQP